MSMWIRKFEYLWAFLVAQNMHHTIFSFLDNFTYIKNMPMSLHGEYSTTTL